MPQSVGSPTTNAILYIDYDGRNNKFVFVDASGAPTSLVDQLKGPRGTNVSWRIYNKTGSNIYVTIDNFRQSGSLQCPVYGLSNCELYRQPIVSGGYFDQPAALAWWAGSGKYNYDVAVSLVDTSRGDPLDPELQIDGYGLGGYLMAALVAAGLLSWALRRRRTRHS